MQPTTAVRRPVIAIVDDEQEQRNAVSKALEMMSECHTFTSAEMFLAHMKSHPAFDLIILDWSMPNVSGIEALRQLRQDGYKSGVLFLTSRSSEQEIVTALNAGADDYLVKPLRVGELQARVKSLLRRTAHLFEGTAQNIGVAKAEPHTLFSATELGIVCDRAACTIAMPGQKATELTQREYELALYFIERINTPISRDAVMQAIWRHAEIPNSRTLDTHISKIRSKLNLRPEVGWRLTPVYSFGYRLDYQMAST